MFCKNVARLAVSVAEKQMKPEEWSLKHRLMKGYFIAGCHENAFLCIFAKISMLLREHFLELNLLKIPTVCSVRMSLV